MRETRRFSLKLTAVFALSILLLTACSMPDPLMDESNTQQPKKTYSPEEVAAKYRRNPAPRQRYDITMKIENAPGPFGFVKWHAQYDSPDCVYTMRGFSGVHGHPHTGIPVEFRKIDDTTYAGVVYADAMLDENYFGKGVCQWTFRGMSVHLMATGDEKETTFIASISADRLKADGESKTYFASLGYPRETMDAYSDFGDEDINKYKPELRDGLFVVTLTPHERK